MSTAPAPARRAVPAQPTSRTHGETSEAGDLDEQRHRGRLTISDKVMEKIAGQAAAEVATSRGRTGGVLGIGSEADASARPKVDVDLLADSVDFGVALGIAYPGSVRDAAQQVRDYITRRVQDLTGVPVHRVDVNVIFLTTTIAGSGRSARPTKKELR